jgi:hypothetical protein
MSFCGESPLLKLQAGTTTSSECGMALIVANRGTFSGGQNQFSAFLEVDW